MKMKNLRFSGWIKIIGLSMLLLSYNNAFAQKEKNNEMIKKFISEMSLKQKSQLLIGTGMFFELPDSIAKKYGSFLPKMIDPNDSAYSAMVENIRKFVPGAAGNTAMFEKLGITTQVLADGPAGLRIQPKRKGDENNTYYCTAFPIATVLASTWDTDLVYKVGQAMGSEVKEYGVDVILGPGMNLQRDPLCGRNFEYYSEDPIITGKMGANMVKGIQSNGVGTSIKHFAANNQETNRLSVNTIVSERKEGKPWTVMSSYNKINGVYASESHDLLTKILRNDWGFQGYVMTDWGGGSDLVAQMIAGNDLIMPGSPQQINDLIKLVVDGKLKESVLDVNIARILNIMLISPHYNKFNYSSKPDLKAHALVTRQAATDGMVLLENKTNALPFAKNIKNIAAFGNSSYDFISGGTGSGDVNEAYTISLIQGIENVGYKADQDLMNTYTEYMKEAKAKQPKSSNWLTALMGGKVPLPEMEVSKDLATKMVSKSDIALITIGRNSGEGGDREPKEGDFYLTKVELDMIKNVSEVYHAAGKKVVVVLNIGGAIETASWKNIPDAVLLAWQPGQEAGNSVIDVVSGKVNPSGKLAVSFPIKYEDAPSAKTFPGHAIGGTAGKEEDKSGFSFMQRVPWEVTYTEDIFVGYRYYNTYNVPVSYEFGYGLSYTVFKFSGLKINSKKFDKKLTASVTVKNTGKVSGREVVQVYLSAPSQKMKKAKEVLISFGKSKLLKAGESQILSFEICPRDLCSFDETTSSWVAEAGEYTVNIGSSSIKIEQNAKFSLDKELVVEKVSKALAPEKAIEMLEFKKRN